MVKNSPVKYKKAPQAPRRFKSSYMFFSSKKHKEIRKELAEKNEAEKIQTTDIAKMVSAAWKALPAEERQKFEDMAKKDKARYEVERNMYTGPWKVPATRRPSKDPNAPKRPMSAFLAYSNCKRAEVKAQNPDIGSTEMSRILATMWKAAPEEEKEKFKVEEARLREAYKIKASEWRRKRDCEKQEARKLREDEAHRIAEATQNGNGHAMMYMSGENAMDPAASSSVHYQRHPAHGQHISGYPPSSMSHPGSSRHENPYTYAQQPPGPPSSYYHASPYPNVDPSGPYGRASTSGYDPSRHSPPGLPSIDPPPPYYSEQIPSYSLAPAGYRNGGVGCEGYSDHGPDHPPPHGNGMGVYDENGYYQPYYPPVGNGSYAPPPPPSHTMSMHPPAYYDGRPPPHPHYHSDQTAAYGPTDGPPPAVSHSSSQQSSPHRHSDDSHGYSSRSAGDSFVPPRAPVHSRHPYRRHHDDAESRLDDGPEYDGRPPAHLSPAHNDDAATYQQDQRTRTMSPRSSSIMSPARRHDDTDDRPAYASPGHDHQMQEQARHREARAGLVEYSPDDYARH